MFFELFIIFKKLLDFSLNFYPNVVLNSFTQLPKEIKIGNFIV